MTVEEVVQNVKAGCKAPMLTFVRDCKMKLVEAGLCTSYNNYVADWLFIDKERKSYGKQWWCFVPGEDDLSEIYFLFKSENVCPAVRCKECTFNYGLGSAEGFNPEDIVCSYWSSDGLTENDFCSRGERMKICQS